MGIREAMAYILRNITNALEPENSFENLRVGVAIFNVLNNSGEREYNPAFSGEIQQAFIKKGARIVPLIYENVLRYLLENYLDRREYSREKCDLIVVGELKALEGERERHVMTEEYKRALDNGYSTLNIPALRRERQKACTLFLTINVFGEDGFVVGSGRIEDCFFHDQYATGCFKRMAWEVIKRIKTKSIKKDSGIEITVNFYNPRSENIDYLPPRELRISKSLNELTE